MTKLEVLPVPPEFVPKLWKSVRRVAFSKIPNYDIERTHMRLLVGQDQLWVAFGPDGFRGPDGQPRQCLCGVIVTTISKRPPQQRNAFKRSNPERMKSLIIHLAGEHKLPDWLDSAIERINLYAREQGCHMLFVMARKGWHKHLKRWYSREWEAVAISRDRPTVSTCSRFKERNKPGYFRLLVPVPPEKWNRFKYSFMSTCYFKAEAA